jgi:hypothetical protein
MPKISQHQGVPQGVPQGVGTLPSPKVPQEPIPLRSQEPAEGEGETKGGCGCCVVM